MDLVVRNGTVVTPQGTFVADVGISGEHIEALGARLRAPTELDASGCFVLPGAVDPHVHLQMPSGRYRSSDTFTTGTIAAALGGTTTVIDFVEPPSGTPLLKALRARRQEADGAVAVDYGLHMTIPTWYVSGRGELEALEAISAAGVPSFKLYLAYEGLRLNDRQLYRAMQAIARAGGLAVAHCENGPVCDELRDQAIACGHTEPIYHALTRPPRQEAESTGRAIDIAALTRCPLYVVHVSCAQSLEHLRAARTQGQKVHAETCPQYLLLSQDALAGPDGELLICAPPLRPAENQDALWHALARGDLDVLATDHCPFLQADKRGHPDFTTIPGGLPSIEGRLSLAYTFGRRHGVSLERWVEVCCANPARIFGLQRKGVLAPGHDADVVVFDPQHGCRLSAGKTLHEHVDWSPYEGQRADGWVRDVLSRGRFVVRDHQFVGQPGCGRFVARAVGKSVSGDSC